MRIVLLLCVLLAPSFDIVSKNSSTEGHKAIKNSSLHRTQSFAHDMAARFSTIFESIISRVLGVGKQATIATDTIIQTSGPVAQDYVQTKVTTTPPPPTLGLLTTDVRLTVAANGDITFDIGSYAVSGGTVTISTPGTITGLTAAPDLILNPGTGTEVVIDGSLNLSSLFNDNYFNTSRLVHITRDATFNGNNNCIVSFNSDLTVDGTLNIINNRATGGANFEGVIISSAIAIQADTINFNNNRGDSGGQGDPGATAVILNDTSTVTATNSITFSNNRGANGSDGEPGFAGGNGGFGVSSRGTLTAPNIHFNNNIGGNGGIGDPNGLDGVGVFVDSTATVNGTVFIVQNCTGGANQEFFNNGGSITVLPANITNTGNLCSNTGI